MQIFRFYQGRKKIGEVRVGGRIPVSVAEVKNKLIRKGEPTSIKVIRVG